MEDVKSMAASRNARPAISRVGVWWHTEFSTLLRAMAVLVLVTGVVFLVLISAVSHLPSSGWWVALVLIIGSIAYAVGMTAILAGRLWGWAGLWTYVVERDLDDVVPTVERGLSGAGVSFVPTARRPTRRSLRKATHAFEMPGGVAVWIVPVLRKGQFRGSLPETLVAIEDAERMPPEGLQKVKDALARALSTEQGW